MIPKTGDPASSRRTSNRFSIGKLTALTPLTTKKDEWTPLEDGKTNIVRNSTIPIGHPGSETQDVLTRTSSSPRIGALASSPTVKPQTLQRKRPGSKFGSVGRRSIMSLEEESVITDEHSGSPSGSMTDDADFTYMNEGQRILYHGEVQTTIGLFRKKKEYLVLSDTHLLRFKSFARALDFFPKLLRTNRRSSSSRHGSTTSVGSVPEIQSLNSRSSHEGDSSILLNQIVATYRVEDGRPYFITEVAYLDETNHAVGSIQLMLQDPREADLWHTSIRAAAEKSRLVAPQEYPTRIVDYVLRYLELVQDYDPISFQLFRVVRRAPNKAAGKSSSDDLSKLSSSVNYLALGITRVHLFSLPDFSEPLSRPLETKATKSSYGLVTLVSMDIQHTDDTFEMGFRLPLQPVVMLSLASSTSRQIATLMFRTLVYLKPQWLDYTFLFSGPKEVLNDTGIDLGLDEDSGCFDRTLIAYCLAYGCNPTNIRYTIDYEAEDSPEFILLPPADSRRYSVPELLAIFRSLRYNECFQSISFAGIDLGGLHGLVDTYGIDHVAFTSRSGLPVKKYFSINPQGQSLLYQEVQALALKTYKTRRLNFKNTLPRRRPKDSYDEETAKDPGCEIAAGLLPLCRAQLTNVDWVVLSGIELGETDLDEIGPALQERLSHFRCLEASRCGLSDRGLQLILNNMEKQAATMECINISDNPGRIHLNDFPITMSRFTQIRKLDLSRATSTSGDEPLIPAEVMLAWRLEELILTGVPINDKTLEAIASYVSSPMSASLRLLQLDQCNLTGTHVAILMRSMCHVPGEARDLHLQISTNRLEKGNSDIVSAIKDCRTPSKLSMRMVEYQTESRFRQLLEALRYNTTIKSLDISKASLPYDAGEDTCLALQRVFEDNTTLEELDISGEHAHLEIARFGIGLNHALTGLKKNKALRVLKLEYQSLGLEGAHTLASVLEYNDTLTHIYCEHNNINLQGFTILVNALAQNFTVVHLPLMSDDQLEAVKHMRQAISQSTNAVKGESGAKHAVRKTLNTLGVHKKQELLPTPQDIEQAVQIMNSKWIKQKERLMGLLQRNISIASGTETRSLYEDDLAMKTLMRPATAGSDSGIVENVMRNTTPRVERMDPVGTYMDNRPWSRQGTGDDEGKHKPESSPGNRKEKLTKQRPGGRDRSMSDLTSRIGKFDFEFDREDGV